MVWVRLEDNYPRNRKVAALSDAAFRLDVSAICWSNTTGADGRILPHELTDIRSKASPKVAAELVAQGRWHVAGTPCPHSDTCPPSTPDGGGWVIHDIWDQQKPAAVVEEEKRARAQRQRKYMERVNASRRNASTDASSRASPNASHGASTDAQADDAPSPPRPAPKGGRGLTSPQRSPAADGDGAAAGGEAEKHTIVTVDTAPADGFGLVDEAAIAARVEADRMAHERSVAEHEATTQRGLAAARAALRRNPKEPAA